MFHLQQKVIKILSWLVLATCSPSKVFSPQFNCNASYHIPPTWHQGEWCSSVLCSKFELQTETICSSSRWHSSKQGLIFSYLVICFSKVCFIFDFLYPSRCQMTPLPKQYLFQIQGQLFFHSKYHFNFRLQYSRVNVLNSNACLLEVEFQA